MAKNTVPPPPPDFPEDGLWGPRAIAIFLYGGDSARETRRVYCLASHSKLPFFRVGGMLCLRRSTLLEVIEKARGEAADRDETVADSGSSVGPVEGKDGNPGASED